MRDVQAEISLTADTSIILTGSRLGAMAYVVPTLNGFTLTVAGYSITGRTAFHLELGGWVMLAGGSVVTPDVTPPTAGTLAASSITSDSFTLTASGASDDVALAAAPYSFSIDGGSSWSAYQASPVYTVTGRPSSTTHTCLHRVKDTSNNPATGASISVDTLAPATSWASLISTYPAYIASQLDDASGPPLTDDGTGGKTLLESLTTLRRTKNFVFEACITDATRSLID